MSISEKSLQELTLDKLIQGINEFTALSRQRALTESETRERQHYREEYIRRISWNLRATLDNTDFEFAGEENGSDCQKTD